MFRHRRSSILLAICARRLGDVSEQNFVDGKSEGIYKDSEQELLICWMSNRINWICG